MKKSLEIKRTAHYYLQYPKQPIQSILFVIHGYAQLAKEFLQDFNSLEESNVLVVAPEALSKFYNKERKPVANWMTSHEREDEIADYINYLNSLHSILAKEYPNLPVNVLGFSQGVSTALRWVTHSIFKPECIHLCSGSIPPELEIQDFDTLLNTSFFYYYGDQDRLLKVEVATQQIELLKQLVHHLTPVYFEGRHEVPKECIANLMH